jgi:hypothetical protein
MALSAIDTSICNKLVSDYNSIAAPIYAAKAMVRSKMAEVETQLRGMVFSAQSAINGAIIDFQNDIAAALPKADLSAMNDLKQFIDQCLYLGDFSPMSVIMGTAAGVNDYMNKLIGDNTLPEFGASGLFSGINDSFGTGGVTNSFNQADALLNCLSLICATEDPAYWDAVAGITADLNNLYITLNVIDSGVDRGKFDTDAVYNNAGLDSIEKGKITQVTSTIDGAKSDSAAAIEASASKVQELTKAGDFF